MQHVQKFHRTAAVLLALAVSSALPASAAKTSYGSAGTLAGTSARSTSSDTAPASATLREGLNALDRGDMGTALNARAKLAGGSLERKVLAWSIALNGRGVDAVTLSGIADDLASWPQSKTIRRNVERAVVRELSGESLRVAFSRAAPESVTAAIALARAHKSAGDTRAARAVIAPIWTDNVLDAADERTILSSLGSVLTREDHAARVDHLLAKRRIKGAERIAGKAGMTRLVAARAAVERKQRDAEQRLAAVPKSQQGSATQAISKAKYLRGRERISQAAAILDAVPAKAVRPQASDQFWTEARIVSSELLAAGKPQLAYRAVQGVRPDGTVKTMDQAFKAGWIALRKLNDAKTARAHFERLVSIAENPISVARGQYWLGRAHAAAGSSKSASAAYAKAAAHDETYYGQLAAVALGRKSLDVSKPSPSSRERSNFAATEQVQAIAKLESAGHPNRAKPLYRHLASLLPTAGEVALLAYRAEKRGDHQLGLQVGKVANQRGLDVDSVAWPLGAIPRSTKTGKVGLALAYAIARQESTFQIDARSSANALGLLQLLPETAKRTARSIGVKYSRDRLVTDGGYNAQLGTAYLDQQMDRFGGSYALTFAAYNAGPRRAAEWIERNGDPRGASLEEAIDWVEEIPFAETRNYVQRVMENMQTYRARLEGARLTIDRDLRAGTR
ncbi:lytic transglycosylase domain-containing protein [Rhizobiaceae bacterium]|nr:lytic transglycosylase domain-containing protein [Rhizobiaceae bacterium]